MNYEFNGTNNGNNNSVGPQGSIGPRGIQGNPGKNGPPGREGHPGRVGPPGMPGIKGDSGEQGLIGHRGHGGSPGEKGIKGDLGPIGEGGEGPKGQIGPTGFTGPTGCTGVYGPTGLKGEPGSIGQGGPIGTRGVQGNKGDLGPRGTDGNSLRNLMIFSVIGIPGNFLTRSNNYMTGIPDLGQLKRTNDDNTPYNTENENYGFYITPATSYINNDIKLNQYCANILPYNLSNKIMCPPFAPCIMLPKGRFVLKGCNVNLISISDNKTINDSAGVSTKLVFSIDKENYLPSALSYRVSIEVHKNYEEVNTQNSTYAILSGITRDYTVNTIDEKDYINPIVASHQISQRQLTGYIPLYKSYGYKMDGNRLDEYQWLHKNTGDYDSDIDDNNKGQLFIDNIYGNKRLAVVFTPYIYENNKNTIETYNNIRTSDIQDSDVTDEYFKSSISNGNTKIQWYDFFKLFGINIMLDIDEI